MGLERIWLKWSCAWSLVESGLELLLWRAGVAIRVRESWGFDCSWWLSWFGVCIKVKESKDFRGSEGQGELGIYGL